MITATLEAEWQDDPITERQIARLRCYRLPYTARTTKGEAAKLINAWLNAHPKAAARDQRRKAGAGLTWLGQLLAAVFGFQKGKGLAKPFHWFR